MERLNNVGFHPSTQPTGDRTRATYQLFAQTFPTAQLMSEIGLLALVANLICFLLLIRHRNDNINMSSVWLCSRNDIIANTI